MLIVGAGTASAQGTSLNAMELAAARLTWSNCSNPPQRLHANGSAGVSAGRLASHTDNSPTLQVESSRTWLYPKGSADSTTAGQPMQGQHVSSCGLQLLTYLGTSMHGHIRMQDKSIRLHPAVVTHTGYLSPYPHIPSGAEKGYQLSPLGSLDPCPTDPATCVPSNRHNNLLGHSAGAEHVQAADTTQSLHRILRVPSFFSANTPSAATSYPSRDACL